RNIHQEFRAVLCEIPDLVGKDRFVADKDTKFLSICRQRLARRATGEIPYRGGQSSRKIENLRKRDVLTEGDEMNLVVARRPLARGTDQGSRVVDFGFLAGGLHRIAHPDASD